MSAICVYCSSSNVVAPIYFDAARELGQQIALRGHTLVYGGSDVGLMGALAHAASDNGGRVIGAIPHFFEDKGLAYTRADELYITRDMRERKAWMEERADAFFALPGGFGTLEELSEMLTARQLQLHTKPMVLLNTQGFYDALVNFFEHIYSEQFAKFSSEFYYVAPSITQAFDYFDHYEPTVMPTKWL